MSDVIWPILDPDAQYFDIWDTFHDKEMPYKYFFENIEPFLSNPAFPYGD